MCKEIIRAVDYLGRVVIPKEVREVFKIKEGDELTIKINENKIILEKINQEDFVN